MEWMRKHLRYDSLDWDGIQVGDELPTVVREVDATLVAVGAISGTRDFYPVHHDKEFALATGAQDIFMNILTSNGVMGAYVTNWCGPDWDLVDLTIRLMVPNYPGDKMTTSGKVVRKWKEKGRRLVEVEFTGENSQGPHAMGSAVVAAAAAAS